MINLDRLILTLMEISEIKPFPIEFLELFSVVEVIATFAD